MTAAGLPGITRTRNRRTGKALGQRFARFAGNPFWYHMNNSVSGNTAAAPAPTEAGRQRGENMKTSRLLYGAV